MRLKSVLFTLFTLLLFSIATSCSKAKNQTLSEKQGIANNNASNPERVNDTAIGKATDKIPFIDPKDFKFSKLPEFNLSKWHLDTLFEGLKTPTAQQLKSYLPEKVVRPPENYKLYSLQTLQPDLKIITMIAGFQSCCMYLHYLVYDGNDRLLSDNVVAGTGGDGEWTFNHSGQFINDSTYLFTAVDMEAVDTEKSDSYRVDSLVIHYRFDVGQEFEELNEEKFTSYH